MAVVTRYEVIQALRNRAAEIRRLGVRSLRLFGSFARDEHRPDSDLDLLVEFESGAKTYDRFLELHFLLEEITGRRVELLTKEGLSPYIGPKIEREAQDVPLGS